MAFDVTTAPSRSILDSLGSAVARLARALAKNSGPMRCKREADRLFALSDAELAGLGLTRDGVIAHAFRRYAGS